MGVSRRASTTPCRQPSARSCAYSASRPPPTSETAIRERATVAELKPKGCHAPIDVPGHGAHLQNSPRKSSRYQVLDLRKVGSKGVFHANRFPTCDEVCRRPIACG